MNGNLPKVSIDGIGIYYEVHGEGQPLMLVHGAMASHTMWEYMVEDLSKSFKVITCDLRGHGESDKGDPSTYSIKLFADDIRGLLDKLGIEKVHLVGYSMGGLVAEQFAVDYPERLHTLVLGGRPVKVPPFFNWLVSLTFRLIRFQRFAKLMFRRVPYDRRSYVVKRGIEAYSKAGKTVRIADVKASRAYLQKLPDELSSIFVPVLIVWGEKDSLVNREELHKLIPNPRVAIVEGATHAITAEKPEVFSRLISDFCVAKGPQLSH